VRGGGPRQAGPAARAAVASLIRKVERTDPRDKSELLVFHVVEAHGRIGPDAMAAIPTMNRRLIRKGYTNGFVANFEVLVALYRIGAPPVAQLLHVFLRDANLYIAEKLAWLGPKARAAIPSKHSNPLVRMWAREALAQILPKHAPSTTPPRPIKSVAASLPPRVSVLPLDALCGR
jgi:hypothetical protein